MLRVAARRAHMSWMLNIASRATSMSDFRHRFIASEPSRATSMSDFRHRFVDQRGFARHFHVGFPTSIRRPAWLRALKPCPVSSGGVDGHALRRAAAQPSASSCGGEFGSGSGSGSGRLKGRSRRTLETPRARSGGPREMVRLEREWTLNRAGAPPVGDSGCRAIGENGGAFGPRRRRLGRASGAA